MESVGLCPPHSFASNSPSRPRDKVVVHVKGIPVCVCVCVCVCVLVSDRVVVHVSMG